LCIAHGFVWRNSVRLDTHLLTPKPAFLKGPLAENRAGVSNMTMKNSNLSGKVAVNVGMVPLIEYWRGEQLESAHSGHAVICDASGAMVDAWGNPDAVFFPRSSCKILQAMPLLESGAGADLPSSHLALACASHLGEPIHTDLAARWLDKIGLAEPDLRCGCQEPDDRTARADLIRAGQKPCQLHNTCSGKHVGFLMLNKHLGGGSEYVEPDHAVQLAVRQTFEEITGLDSPGYGIDGCCAPNFSTTMHGMARAMAFFAKAQHSGNLREQSAARLRDAMAAHPNLVAGEAHACTQLMRAVGGGIALKNGSDAVFIGILPKQGLGITVKVLSGADHAASAVMAALLIRAGLLDPAHPAALSALTGPLRNRRGNPVGAIRLAPGFA
jgi:L-asparaginase II